MTIRGNMKSYLHALSRKLLTAAFFVTIAASVSTVALGASVVTLTSGNSSATVDLGSQAGMSQWLINGQNQLNQQWFWYRVDNDPTGQHSIDTIGGLTYANNPNAVD